MLENELQLQVRMHNQIAFHAEMIGDIMYFHQSLKQPDASNFIQAVVKEANGHVANKHWELIKHFNVPKLWKLCHQCGQCIANAT